VYCQLQVLLYASAEAPTVAGHLLQRKYGLACMCMIRIGMHAHADAADEASLAQALARSQRRCLVCSFKLLPAASLFPIPTEKRFPAPFAAQRELTLANKIYEYLVSSLHSGQPSLT